MEIAFVDNSDRTDLPEDDRERRDVLLPRTCPRGFFEPWINEAFELYAHYERGHLLNPGGIAGQPAIYLEAMSVISRQSAHLTAIEMKKKTERR